MSIFTSHLYADIWKIVFGDYLVEFENLYLEFDGKIHLHLFAGADHLFHDGTVGLLHHADPQGLQDTQR